MAVFLVHTWEAQPGRLDEFVDSIRDALHLATQISGPQLERLFRVAVGGQDTGQIILSVEYEDLAAYSNDMMTLGASDEWQALAERYDEPDPPATRVSTVLFSEIIPRAIDGAATGSILHSVAGQVKPGRMKDYVAQLNAISELATSTGALQVYHAIADVGGANTGHILTVGEFESLEAFGRAQAKRVENAEFQSRVAALSGPDGPVIPLGRQLLTEIPL